MPAPDQRIVLSFEAARYYAAAAVAALLAGTVAAAFLARDFDTYARFLFLSQDVGIALLFVTACLLPLEELGSRGPFSGANERRIVWLSLVVIISICWIGRFLIFGDFDGTPDERLVAFDASIFRNGALVWPIPPEWRPLASALNLSFMLPVGNNQAWVSGYLPVNATLHAIVGSVIDEDFTSPLLVGAGAYFVWRIALQFWPSSPGPRLAALAFYVGSSQVLVTGMTKFAMNAHLTLNLMWLMLFLRGHRSSHAMAMIVGLFATGLHQPLFHPLFVAPFLLMLILQRRARLFVVYMLAYACIISFWLLWPAFITSLGDHGSSSISSPSNVSYFGRLLATLTNPSLGSVWLMAANLIRFISWQHLLVLPFAILGTFAAWKHTPIVRPLVIGLIGPIFVFWILLPWQGTGWGYRYLHPVLGNLILLGGWGWNALEEKRGTSIRGLLGWSTLVSVILLLPLHAWMAHRVVQPLADLDSQIALIDADVVIIDDHIFEVFVHNEYDLSNRPVRLISSAVPRAEMASLCSRGTIAFLDPPIGQRESSEQQGLKSVIAGVKCDTKSVRVEMADHLVRATQ